MRVGAVSTKNSVKRVVQCFFRRPDPLPALILAARDGKGKRLAWKILNTSSALKACLNHSYVINSFSILHYEYWLNMSTK